MTTLLWIWACWAAAWVALFLLSAWLVRPDWPCFNGFVVHIPATWYAALTREELIAVVEHELGHRSRAHPWLNLARVCCFLPHTRGRRERQELEADDCVTHPRHMASALMRMSAHPFDVYRAARLIGRAQKGRQEAGSPAAGTAGTTTHGEAK